MYIKVGATKLSVSFWFALSICGMLMLDDGGAIGSAFLSALLHELGHILAFKMQGRTPKEVRFTPFGLMLVRDPQGKLSYRNEIQAALSGPLVNLCLCIVAFIIGGTCQFFYINAALFAFNMMPVVELDGGRALYACMSLKRSPEFAARVLTILSTMCVTALFALFFVLSAYGTYNYSLFLAAFYLGSLVLFRCILKTRKSE